MKIILVSFLALAALLLFTSAVPLDKVIDEFNQILRVDVPKTSKKFLQKKGKPPGKQPGPKLSLDAMSFGFLPQIPMNVIPITRLQQDGERRQKKYLFQMHAAPLQEEPKNTPLNVETKKTPPSFKQRPSTKETVQLTDPPSGDVKKIPERKLVASVP